LLNKAPVCSRQNRRID